MIVPVIEGAVFVLLVCGLSIGVIWAYWGTGRKPDPRPRRADPVRIAVLEWEIFGIQPEPGTMAAAAVGMKRLGGAQRAEPDFVDQYANPALIGTERR